MHQTETLYSDTGNCFEKYNGQATEVELLSGEDVPLTIIGAKAFLSCKSIGKLILPDSLECVEDWGFAHMKNLQEITLPAKEIVFGKKVFLGCDNLRRVSLNRVTMPEEDVQMVAGRTCIYEGIYHFLASMFRFFPEKILENLKMAGDEQEQWKWLVYYDEALQKYIKRPDDYDFEPTFIGWFDIEDVDDQKKHFTLQQRKQKIKLAFQRLLYDEKLSEQNRQYLGNYITEESALVEEMFSDAEEACSKDIRFYGVWKQIGGLNRDCAGRLLERISEEEPELRGYLLKIQLENVDNSDFFNELDL